MKNLERLFITCDYYTIYERYSFRSPEISFSDYFKYISLTYSNLLMLELNQNSTSNLPVQFSSHDLDWYRNSNFNHHVNLFSFLKKSTNDGQNSKTRSGFGGRSFREILLFFPKFYSNLLVERPPFNL